MSNTRLRQLSEMYSFVTGASPSDALRIICNTTTGKRIAEGNASFLYEQQTSNLASVAAELPSEIQKLFSEKKICQSMQALNKPAYIYQMPAVPEYKKRLRKSMKKLQKKRLRIAAANQALMEEEGREEGQPYVDNSEK